MAKNPLAKAGDMRCEFDLWVAKSPWSREWQPTAVFLPGKSHGQRRLAGYSLWGPEEADATEWLSTQGEGERKGRKMGRRGRRGRRGRGEDNEERILRNFLF